MDVLGNDQVGFLCLFALTRVHVVSMIAPVKTWFESGCAGILNHETGQCVENIDLSKLWA